MRIMWQTRGSLRVFRPLRGFCTAVTATTEQSQPPVRVRYAPSPTGNLHLGGLRTALFNSLLVRKYGGSYILRIEDTDQTRLVPGSADKIEEILNWAGIEFDESPTKGGPYGPYIQSQRLHIYKEHLDRLVKAGNAYQCFCTAKDLEERRGPEGDKMVMYDRRCLHLPVEGDKINNPTNQIPLVGQVTFTDLVGGPISFDSKLISDPIIMKSDGYPTYHLASVVDDHLMKITHVIRGQEWVTSCPKHLLLYDLLGWPRPLMAHMSLLIRHDGKKLSKRNNDAFVEYYRDKGYSADALCNYLTCIGVTQPASNLELWTQQEMAKWFTFKSLSPMGTIIGEKKLKWFSKQYLIKTFTNDSNQPICTSQMKPYLELLKPKLEMAFPHCNKEYLTDTYMIAAVILLKERITSICDIVDLAPYLWREPDYLDNTSKNWAKKMWNAKYATLLYQSLLSTTSDSFTAETLHKTFKALATTTGVNTTSFLILARLAITSQKIGAGVVDTCVFLGRQRSIDRIKTAIGVYGGDESD